MFAMRESGQLLAQHECIELREIGAAAYSDCLAPGSFGEAQHEATANQHEADRRCNTQTDTVGGDRRHIAAEPWVCQSSG